MIKSRLIKREEDGRKYPCLVVDEQIGDGEQPTVYLKPDKLTSVIMVRGYLHNDSNDGLPVGHIIDARNPDVRSNYGLEDGEGIHEGLPIFTDQVVLEN